MIIRINEGVHVPSACVVGTKDTRSFANQRKGRRARLLVVKDIDEAPG
jgi:hypothetical protein